MASENTHIIYDCIISSATPFYIGRRVWRYQKGNQNQ